ncbi:HTH domain-containing putative transcription regulator [Desulfocapsa sulfexigens DSM 10523]|uniref:HTH domain-containing putative transcription regulator n=1 Tax=Desulfocapsa sulfexigens (strain DSM 10523 / SB164P1) TaxID=1167006 RepID=M1PAX8_DESSD|nr:transcriptional regulator [Desulfocapsa sulfexigens]AGF78807.1 HTH domain-containing putative transcription regulator [Desulfocapsa sulfexigens DSM 10523]
METQLEDIANVWPKIKSIFSVPHTEEEYEHLVSMLDNLIDEVGENENHPLASLMESIGNLIETYENKNVPTMHGHPIESLRYLMKEHNLKQTDLPEIGSQGVVSEILKGKRHLNIRQVKELSLKFNISPLVFIQDN